MVDIERTSFTERYTEAEMMRLRLPRRVVVTSDIETPI